MPYPAKDIANWFIARARREGEYLTQMKLQKMAYIAHGWNMGFDGGPLVNEPIEAWQYGPVIRDLYVRYLKYGAFPITEDPGFVDISKDDEQLLEWVWNQYKPYTAGQLSAITHKDGTPWKQTYLENTKKDISQAVIEAHYKDLVDQMESASAGATK